MSLGSHARLLLTSVALAAAVVLAGCNTNDPLATNAKANQPVPPKLIADMNEKDMDLQSPILVRLFKQEAELEVWKQTRSGQFALLKTYPICRWSGDLGPKVREGDRQAPEGFYSITPGQMNPQSSYYLSFNTGYPNAFDRALGRTGSQLMVHGDCSSRGCYAMTDEQIGEIYSLGRESFFGGQRAFQMQAYPFRMTPLNMAKHRNNPHMPFWKMIKEGYDHFDVTRQEPKVDFCEKKYVFDAAKPPDARRDPVFDASAKCPAYVIPDDIAQAVREKQQRDEVEYAKLVAKGTPVARLNTGVDGGMNKVFAAKLPNGNTGLSEGSEGLSMLAMSRAPGTIPSTVNPPKMPDLSKPDRPAAAPAPAPATTTRVAAVSQGNQSESMFSSLARKMGFGAGDTTATTSQAAPTRPKAADPQPATPRTVVAARPTESKPAAENKPQTQHAAARPPLKPSVTENAAAAPADKSFADKKDGQIAGAAPIVPASSFESRFSAMK